MNALMNGTTSNKLLKKNLSPSMKYRKHKIDIELGNKRIYSTLSILKVLLN